MKIYVKAGSSQELSRDYIEDFYIKFEEAFDSKFGISPDRISMDGMPREIKVYFTDLKLNYISFRFARSDWDNIKVRTDYDKFDKLRVMQGWDRGIWDVNIPYDLIDSPNLVDIIITKLSTLSSFKKYLVSAEVKKWPSARKWHGLDTTDSEFEDMWSTWLAKPEKAVNSELKIFPEPSIQGNSGGVFIYDQSGEGRTDNGYPWYEGWGAWCEWEVNAAAASKNASEYQKKYREHIKELGIGIFGNYFRSRLHIILKAQAFFAEGFGSVIPILGKQRGYNQ